MGASWSDGRQVHHQAKGPHEPCVFPRPWRSPKGPAWVVQVRVGGGRRWYGGTFTDYQRAVQVARQARAERDAAAAVQDMVPISGKPSTGAGPSYVTNFGR